MICFCYFSIFGKGHNDLFCANWVQKNNFKEVLPTFFQNLWIATQVININCIP